MANNTKVSDFIAEIKCLVCSDKVTQTISCEKCARIDSALMDVIILLTNRLKEMEDKCGILQVNYNIVLKENNKLIKEIHNLLKNENLDKQEIDKNATFNVNNNNIDNNILCDIDKNTLSDPSNTENALRETTNGDVYETDEKTNCNQGTGDSIGTVSGEGNCDNKINAMQGNENRLNDLVITECTIKTLYLNITDKSKIPAEQKVEES